MQAVLILAHKNVAQVLKLSKLLSSKFNVYVHFDTKANLTNEDKMCFKKNNINIYSKYNVKWGSYSIVQATVLLIEEALKNADNTYFHLISGQDWPLKSLNEIYNFYENNSEIYLNYWRALDVKKSGEPEIWWVKYYFNYDVINRRSFFGKIYHRLLLLIETITRVNKLNKFNVKSSQIYAGQEWCDIPRYAMEYAINIFKHDSKWQKIFATSFCSDEIWLQTILCNSKYVSNINKNIHRYILEEKRHGTLPAILDETDYSNINKGDYQWGRKFELPYSEKLLRMLNNKIR